MVEQVQERRHCVRAFKEAGETYLQERTLTHQLLSVGEEEKAPSLRARSVQPRSVARVQIGARRWKQRALARRRRSSSSSSSSSRQLRQQQHRDNPLQLRLASASTSVAAAAGPP